MKKTKITGKELRKIGYPEGPVISVAINVVASEYKHMAKDDVETLLTEVLTKPSAYSDHKILHKIAEKLLVKPDNKGRNIELLTIGRTFEIYGPEYIEESALLQMHTASKLPVAVQGALMPDAHHGYGLPIGGVLATKNAVIPYGVGVDIGCRMCLSIFDLPPEDLKTKREYFVNELQRTTLFGSGGEFQKAHDHEVIEDDAFKSTPLLKSLHGRAWKQLGSSGSGNHFVEFGVVDIPEKDETLGVETGRYLALLSHSGSRGLGAAIANHYTLLAMQKCPLPGDAKNLAWLDLNDEAGMEYWVAMNLAGAYASACHEVIHDKIARTLKQKPLKRVENHHNFAWKEVFNGEEVIVHRKGATPAAKNELGIIPGSMASPGYIVKGRGQTKSLQSAGHGAGRVMSRSKAMNSFNHKILNDLLNEKGVTLIGGGLDESPFAYKNIDDVMRAQQDLVDIVGKFTPKIVRMDQSAPKQWKKDKNLLAGE